MARRLLGLELTFQGRRAAALEHLERVERRDRHTPESRLAYGLCSLEVGRLDEAAVTLEREADQEITRERALRWWGEVAERQGRPRVALQKYRELLVAFSGPEAARLWLEAHVKELEATIEKVDDE